MSNAIFELEINHDGKCKSWEFETAQERNDFYQALINRFSGKEYKNKNNALGKKDIIQVSVSNVREDSLTEIADILPEEWYDGELINELLEFVNTEYKNK